MRHIPVYTLFGEAAPRDPDFLHCETIAARSRLYGFNIHPHRHEQMFQMIFLAGGSGAVTLDGVQARLAPPCVVTVPPVTVHGYSFSDDVQGLVLTLFAQQVPLILRASPEAAERLATPRVVPLAALPEAAGVIGHSLAAMAAEFGGHATARGAMMQAHLALAWLALHRAGRGQPDSPAGPAGGADQLSRFRQMIEREYCRRISVADYARQLGMTELGLRRLCRDHLGVTPRATINARIVLEAKRLLAFSTVDVKEVAAAVGFDDHAYFSRFFRRETGLVPTTFRAMRQAPGRG